MNALDAILNRYSAARLAEPGPSQEQLSIILEAGQAAPDHGRLQPWRFVILEGGARDILADSFARLRHAKMPDSAEDVLAKERAKAYRAPTIIAVAARVSEGRIPAIEQILAAGAAVQNMFLAAFALGLGAMWKTGEPAYDAELKTALGLLPDDHIVAFLYLGTPAGDRAPVPRKPGDVVRRLLA